MSTFLIIDGNAIVHRAFHALPPLTDSEGNIVNAVYGFFSMLLKVVEDTHPAYVAICFDRPAPTFRKKLYAAYQAHRPKMADDLSSQIKRLHNALERSHFTIFELDGYEADDLIGTLAYQAVQTYQANVEILTGDRDLLQLANKSVKILAPIMGITKMTEYNEKSVEEKYGIKPSQFIDYKALVGDQSDGYPGITGIGPKTAANLLQKFISYENIYKNIKDIPAKTAEKLVKDAEQGTLAKKLATILTDAPIKLEIEKCSINHITKEDLYTVCSEFSFKSLRTRIESMTAIKSNREQGKLL